MHYTDTLAQRLRALADELESAERYGVPIPDYVTAGKRGIYFDTSHDGSLFDEWLGYCDTVEVAEWVDDNDVRWQRATTDVNGLLVEFGGKVAPVGTVPA